MEVRQVPARRGGGWLSALLVAAMVGGMQSSTLLAQSGDGSLTGPEVCRYLPPGMLEGATFPQPPHYCSANYGSQSTIQTDALVMLKVTQQESADVARQGIRGVSGDFGPAPEFGEGAIQKLETDSTDTVWWIIFSQRCFSVSIWARSYNGATPHLPRAQAKARAIYEQINRSLLEAPCPVGGSTVVTPPPPPLMQDELGASLTCQNTFDDPGLAVCTATVSNAKAGAQIEYEWSFDGSAREARTSELRLDGVQPGAHTVSVIAHDVAHQLHSIPQTVTLAKEPGGSSGGSDLPWAGIAIGVGAAAAAGWGISRIRRGKPGVVGSPVAPRRPPPAEEAPPPQPAAPSQPPEEKRRGPEEIWLEVDRPTLEVHGSGNDEAVVNVVARKRAQGVVVDATSEVRMTAAPVAANPAESRKIVVGAGAPRFSVTGRHVGNTSVRGRMTITAVSTAGIPIAPAYVDITIRPVKLELRIRVFKNGFLDQTVEATLPALPAKVTARVLGPSKAPGPKLKAPQSWTPDPDTGPRHVASARCEATLHIDGGESGGPIVVKSGTDGRVEFQLPSHLVQTYGADAPLYELPAAIELSLDDDVSRSLYMFNQAIEDYGRELADTPLHAPISHTHRLCAVYPQEFLTALRQKDEVDFARLVSAMQRLRASLLFAMKYRKDLKRQRRLFEMAAQDTFNSMVDVVIDLVPIASGVQKWLAGEEIAWRSGSKVATLIPFRELLRILRENAQKSLLFLVCVKAILVLVACVKPLFSAALATLSALLDGQSAVARKAGLPTESIDRLREWKLANPELDEPEAENRGAELANDIGSLLCSIVELAVKGVSCIVHIVLLCGAVALLVFSKGSRIAQDTVAEVLEKYLGDFATELYKNGGTLIDQLLGGSLPPDKTASQKSFSERITNRMAKVEDLDRTCATALEEAWQRSMDLNVGEEWQSRVSMVAKRESEEMGWWQTWDGVTEFLDHSGAFLKLFAKMVQGTVLVAAALGVGLVGIPALLVKFALKSTPAGGVWNPTDALDLSAAIERSVDVLDLCAVRMPILLKESAALGCIYILAPSRIRHLYSAM